MVNYKLLQKARQVSKLRSIIRKLASTNKRLRYGKMGRKFFPAPPPGFFSKGGRYNKIQIPPVPKPRKNKTDHDIVNKTHDQAAAAPLVPTPDLKVQGTPPTIETASAKSINTNGSNPNVMPYATHTPNQNPDGTVDDTLRQFKEKCAEWGITTN